MNKIHPTAIIEKGAQIGDGVEIGAYTFISKKAKIKNGVKIMQGAQIHGDTEIGENTQIFYNAVIGSIPQDLKYKGEDVKLLIGKNNKIREFTFINPGTEGGGYITKIGDNNLIMGYVHIAHDCKIGNFNILANAVTLAGHVEIGNHAVIGGMTPIHQFVKIGDFAMIGGASAVSQDIPPYFLAEGNRAVVKSLNLVGLRRNFKREEIDALKRAFKEIFLSKKALSEAAKELLEKSENEKIKNLCKFIINTKRGIPFERKKNR